MHIFLRLFSQVPKLITNVPLSYWLSGYAVWNNCLESASCQHVTHLLSLWLSLNIIGFISQIYIYIYTHTHIYQSCNYYLFENEEKVLVENYLLPFSWALRDRKVKCVCVYYHPKYEIVYNRGNLV